MPATILRINNRQSLFDRRRMRNRPLVALIHKEEERRRLETARRLGSSVLVADNSPLQRLEYRPLPTPVPFARPTPIQLAMLAGVLGILAASIVAGWL